MAVNFPLLVGITSARKKHWWQLNSKYRECVDVVQYVSMYRRNLNNLLDDGPHRVNNVTRDLDVANTRERRVLARVKESKIRKFDVTSS